MHHPSGYQNLANVRRPFLIFRSFRIYPFLLPLPLSPYAYAWAWRTIRQSNDCLLSGLPRRPTGERIYFFFTWSNRRVNRTEKATACDTRTYPIGWIYLFFFSLLRCLFLFPVPFYPCQLQVSARFQDWCQLKSRFKLKPQLLLLVSMQSSNNPLFLFIYICYATRTDGKRVDTRLR